MTRTDCFTFSSQSKGDALRNRAFLLLLVTLPSLASGCIEDASSQSTEPSFNPESARLSLERGAPYTLLARDKVLEASFHADAIHLSRGETSSLTMRWAGVDKHPSTFAKARPVLAGEEIRYERGAVTEWYKPHAHGLEQGLMLEAAPEFEGQDAIRLTWCIAGTQDAELLEGGRALSLGTASGQKLRVDKLAAWDSTGRRLGARFDLGEHKACEGDVSYNLVVHTDGATFPVTIDPVFQTEDQSFLVDGLGGAFASEPAAMAGNMLAISAPNQPAMNRTGVVYVYERHNGGVNNWGLIQTISSSGLPSRLIFGRNIRLSGDWLVVSAHDPQNELTGQILLYKRTNGQFLLHKALSPTDLIGEETFGRSGLSLDSERLAVGAFGSGDVIIYEKDEGGFENWGESTRISRTDLFAFGFWVSLKQNTLLITSIGSSHTVQLYEQDAQGSWVNSKAFLPLEEHDFSGGLLIQGDQIHIGSHHDTTGRGRVQIYSRNQGGMNNWGALPGSHQPTANATNDYFGSRILLDEDTIYTKTRRLSLPSAPLTEGLYGGAVLFTPNPSSATGWAEDNSLSFSMPYTFEERGGGFAVSNRALIMTSGEEIADPATARAYIFHTNELPIPDDLHVQTEEETGVEMTLTGSDPEGDALEYRLAEDPRHGSVQLLGDKVTYVPERDYVGLDTFTYQIFDGYGLSEEAIVTVEVTPVDDAPLAYEQSASTDEEVAVELRLPSLDRDTDAALLSFTIATPPARGEVTVNGETATYIPEQDFFGEDVFTFTVSDESNTSLPAKVTITVNPINDPPSLTGLPDKIEILDGEELAYTFDASDVDGDTLSFSIENLPTGASLQGATLTWTPSFKQARTHELTVMASDDETSDTGVLTVTVVARDENDNGIADGLEEMQGFDPSNPDDDGDGILDEDEIGDWNDPVDTDGDGTPDVLDTDSDGDGIPDADEGSSDGDGDGIPAFRDKDRDGDGIDDGKDSCVDVSNPEPKDLDEDGIDDACDDDVDFVEDFDWKPGDGEEPPGERGCSSAGSRQRAPIPMTLFLLVGVFGVLFRRRRVYLDI